MFLLSAATLLALAAPGKPDDFWISLATGFHGECATIVSGHQANRRTLIAKVRGRRAVDVMVNREVPRGCVRETFEALREAGVSRIGFVPVPDDVRLVVPPGGCRLEVNDSPVRFSGLLGFARQWSKARRRVHFQPDPEASYGCVDRVLRVLKRAGSVDLGFVGNEVAEPETSQ